MILKAKGDTFYARDKVDRLEFFHKDAALLGVSPQRALLSKFSKHILTMVDLVNQGELSADIWEDIFCDIPNYLMLLEGLLEDLRHE
jgi:hypothetical protein